MQLQPLNARKPYAHNFTHILIASGESIITIA
jgi:hypothetical protein